jgi:hypothetical protein
MRSDFRSSVAANHFIHEHLVETVEEMLFQLISPKYFLEEC